MLQSDITSQQILFLMYYFTCYDQSQKAEESNARLRTHKKSFKGKEDLDSTKTCSNLSVGKKKKAKNESDEAEQSRKIQTDLQESKFNFKMAAGFNNKRLRKLVSWVISSRLVVDLLRRGYRGTRHDRNEKLSSSPVFIGVLPPPQTNSCVMTRQVC